MVYKMGVVRREGNWRLEKREEGVYVVTYQDQPEIKIITADYQSSGFNDERNDFTISVREVQSFSEAEELFQEMADSQSQSGFFGSDLGMPQAGSGGIDTTLEPTEDDKMPNLPPGGLLIVGIVAGGLAVQQGGFDPNSTVTLLGIGLLGLGAVVLGLTYRVYASDGMSAAVEYLISIEEENDNGSSETQTETEPEKTPPTQKRMRGDIYFERADQECEWCEERTDSPEVHHIEPRSEGGPNEYDNLIALCPTCHSKADKGGISKTKLREKVSRQNNPWSKEI